MIDHLIATAPTTAHRQLLELFKQFVESGGTVHVASDPSSAKRIAELERQVAELHDAIARIVAASNDQLKAIIAVDKRIEGMTLERIRVA